MQFGTVNKYHIEPINIHMLYEVIIKTMYLVSKRYSNFDIIKISNTGD